MKAITEGVEPIRFNRAHYLVFKQSKLIFEGVYQVLSADYNVDMVIQQKMNLQLTAGLEERNIHFAFPLRQFTFAAGQMPVIQIAAERTAG